MRDSCERVGAEQVANGGVVDFAQAVVVDSQVDAVVGATHPVELVLVLDDKCVALHFGRDFFDEVGRTGEFQMRRAVVYQIDIHVVVHADSAEVADGSGFGDWCSIGEDGLAARDGYQANEEKQGCGKISFHGAVGSIYAGNGIRSRC